ncbi:SPO22-domain-containing protein [Lindgomyces ingoldianus]|uniref:SPO22-domain-containing protein n=1 Tax=Lindgomyces ingoldianus TaxID=673940 RepID=A0ACB6QA54_9PLEO|nr:SPO22-domain-containing protein [Lindgomyces ingoldianus]KAF2463463.1 SPO22-domain-containing protein [Lindgomyces ingoldianus]
MAPPSAKLERERKLNLLLSFASGLANHFTSSSHDTTLVDDLQLHIKSFPLPVSSATAAKQDELDRLGTELWNLSTRLRRDGAHSNVKTKDQIAQRKHALCLLRVFAMLLLDTAGGQGRKGPERNNCVRLMKVALKAARVCLEDKDLGSATKVLERAADYQDALGKETGDIDKQQAQLVERLRMEYFGVRTILAWRQDRMDTAEHMFSKTKQRNFALEPTTAESLADLLCEIGRDLLGRRNYELAVRWLERAHDMLGEQDLEILSSEAGELRLSIMQSLVQGYIKLKTPEAQKRAEDMVNLLETDYGEKMAVSLLRLELLSATELTDPSQYYTVLLRIIRSAVLNETIFKTIMHHIHKLKNYSHPTACKILDDLIQLRLFREENQGWVEKAIITRIWVGTTSSSSQDILESLHELFENTLQQTKYPLSTAATHAAQTLLWKRVEATYNQEQFATAEFWCNLCLHMLFDKAGELNKSKITRRVILCALARQDYVHARDAFNNMPDTGRSEPITRYLMYKVALHSGDPEFTAECLDHICRHSSKDATLLYACVLEAQSTGDKRQAIVALQKVLDKYDYSAPAGIHLPALLREAPPATSGKLVKDGHLSSDVVEELCKLFEGACAQANASRRRPSNPAQQLFNPSEFEWFSKNAYNLSLKYCAEMHPRNLTRLLHACIEFIRLLQEQGQSETNADLPLRLMFCHFLAACAFITLARAEDCIQDCLQYYLQVRRHGQEFRRTAATELNSEKLGISSHDDIISKHFQIVKLELEAILKLEKWDDLDELFEEVWKYKNPEHYETLADLVLIIHSRVTKSDISPKYQSKVLSVLQKIINFTWRQSNNDIVKLSRWIRCLFRLALPFDEPTSLKCLDQVSEIVATQQGVSLPSTPPLSSSPRLADIEKESNHYPAAELEWLATTSFNQAIDFYVANDDAKCRLWAEKALGLAQWAEDGGMLRGLLMEKYSGLTWQE